MRNRWLISILFFCSLSAVGQTTPAFRQFYFNPYLFNPAFAGTNDYTEVTVLYRQQWLGFKDAPSVTGFTFQIPTQNRVSFGMNFLTQETVALRTTSTQATFAYRIPITERQFLFFGLSGVAGYNDLNLSDADYSNDPTILSAASTQFYGDANFGLVYQVGGLRLGFALPKLFGQQYYSPKDLVNAHHSQFRNQLYSMSYKIRAGDFSFEPYALYRVNRDLQNWWEAATLMYFKDKIWTGASYNSTQGVGFFLGMDFKEKVRFGYSYELPPISKEFINTSSHELHLTLRLGKKRVFKWASQYQDHKVVGELIPAVIEETDKTKPIVVEPPKKTNTEAVIEKTKEKQVPVQEEAKVIDHVAAPTRPPVQPVLSQGYYIIAGSFSTLDNARALIQKLTNSGVANAQVGLNTANQLQYVYVFSSYDHEECRQVRDQLHLKDATRNVWILKIP